MSERTYTQVSVLKTSRADIDAIGAEWRMTMAETVAALIANWKQSTDEQRVSAIRRPPQVRRQRTAVPA